MSAKATPINDLTDPGLKPVRIALRQLFVDYIEHTAVVDEDAAETFKLFVAEVIHSTETERTAG